MLDCIVIGAGPAGLVTTKELLEQGVSEVVCLEQAECLGGVYANSYDSLVLTTSCSFSMFSDFWIGDGNQHNFWTKDEAVDYWKRYAKHFGVLEKIRFNSKVVAVAPQDEGGWQVRLESGEILLSKRVALAIGNNSIPNYSRVERLINRGGVFPFPGISERRSLFWQKRISSRRRRISFRHRTVNIPCRQQLLG